jgi:sorting nexin-29
MLFNITLEKAVRDAGIGKRGTIYHKSIQVLAYADDIDIIG